MITNNFQRSFEFSNFKANPINIGNDNNKYLEKPVSVPERIGNKIITIAKIKYEVLTLLKYAKTIPKTANIRLKNSKSAIQNSNCLAETVKNIFKYR